MGEWDRSLAPIDAALLIAVLDLMVADGFWVPENYEELRAMSELRRVALSPFVVRPMGVDPND